MHERVPPSVFAERRHRLAQALRQAGGGVAVLGTAPPRLRNGDSEHGYRHDSSFFHLTGFVEPEAWLLLHADGHSTLCCLPRDPAREVWDGARLGPAQAHAVLGVDAAHPLEALDALLAQHLAGQPAVWFPFDAPAAEARVRQAFDSLRARRRDGVQAPPQWRDLTPLLDELRLRKDTHEHRLLAQAAAISAAAQVRAMRFCMQRWRSGAEAIAEHEIEAELLHEFRRQGAAGPAYTPIVAAGAQACVLHHAAGSAALGLAPPPGQLHPGELCLIDAGCEYGSYASDLTRTFPADGRFSGPQRAVYQLVQAAQAAAIEVTRPGARKRDGHQAAVAVIAQGLLDLGLLQADRVGRRDDVIASAAYRRFFMHGTGHWLGLDVHDPGEELALDEAPFEQPDGLGGRIVRPPSRRLEPGMVLTVEPGVYVTPADDVPAAFWHIGVRIEDLVWVAPDGPQLLTRGVPVDCDAIEALMAQACDPTNPLESATP